MRCAELKERVLFTYRYDFYSESTDDELQQLLSKLAKSNMSYFVITPATVIPHASEQDLLSFTMPLFPTINEDMNQLLP